MDIGTDVFGKPMTGKSSQSQSQSLNSKDFVSAFLLHSLANRLPLVVKNPLDTIFQDSHQKIAAIANTWWNFDGVLPKAIQQPTEADSKLLGLPIT